MGIFITVKKTPLDNGFTDSSLIGSIFTGPTGELEVLEWNSLSKFGNSAFTPTTDGQYLTSPASSNFNLGTIFTIACWIRFSPYDYQTGLKFREEGCSIVSFFDSSNFYPEGYLMGLSSDGKLSIIYGHGGSVIGQAQGSDDITLMDGGWHHIAYMRNGANLYGYIDGVLECSTTISSTAVHTTPVEDLYIGKSPYSDSSFFTTSIDELEILNGVNKWSTVGFIPPVAESTVTFDHVLLMHFNDDSATPFWYTAKDNDVWHPTGEGGYDEAVYDTDEWISINSDPIQLYPNGNWERYYRPEKMRIVGSVTSVDDITIKDSDNDVIISDSNGADVTLYKLTYDSNANNDDINRVYLLGYSNISNIQFDSKPLDPVLV